MRALEVSPDAPGLLAMSAQAAFAFKRYERCFRDASLSVERGYWPGARAFAIASAAKTGRVDVAQRLLEEAEALGPSMWMEVAEGLHLMGEHEEAARVIPDLLDVLPDAVEVHLLAGTIEIGRRNWGTRPGASVSCSMLHHATTSPLPGCLWCWSAPTLGRKPMRSPPKLLERLPYHAVVGLWMTFSHARRGRFVRSWKQLRTSVRVGAQLRSRVDQLGSLVLARAYVPGLPFPAGDER